MPGILDYLGVLGQAIMGQVPPPQPQAPQQAQAAQGGPTFAPDASGNLQAMQTPPQTAQQPQQGGLMGLLSSPLTQGALGAYLGAIGSPRRAGLGGMLSRGGLTGLQGFNQGVQGQLQQQQAALELQKAQEVAQEAAQKQKVFQGLSPQQQQVAEYPDLAKFQELAKVQEANKQSVAAFQAQHPNDQNAAAFSAPYANSDKYVAPGDIEKDYQEKLQGPLKEKEAKTRIAEQEAQTARIKRTPAAGTEANWYDPITKKYYRGAQKKDSDIPASVAASARSDQEVKARASAWQKAYEDAKKTYIATHTKMESHVLGSPTKIMPSEIDADVYAKGQADAQVNALFGGAGTPSSVAATGAGGADEAASTDDPLSLIPAGATPAMKGDVHGYVDSDGSFHSVE